MRKVGELSVKQKNSNYEEAEKQHYLGDQEFWTQMFVSFQAPLIE